jgi:hypothetical protein
VATNCDTIFFSSSPWNNVSIKYIFQEKLVNQPFFIRDWQWLVTRVTRRVQHVERQLLTLSKHMPSPPDLNGVRVARSLGFCAMFYRSMMRTTSPLVTLITLAQMYNTYLLQTRGHANCRRWLCWIRAWHSVSHLCSVSSDPAVALFIEATGESK